MSPDTIAFTVVSEVQPTSEQLADLHFAWRCVKHVKSNAITIVKAQRLLGMGSGQPNRVNSVRIALEKASDEVQVGTLATLCSNEMHNAHVQSFSKMQDVMLHTWLSLGSVHFNKFQ